MPLRCDTRFEKGFCVRDSAQKTGPNEALFRIVKLLKCIHMSALLLFLDAVIFLRFMSCAASVCKRKIFTVEMWDAHNPPFHEEISSDWISVQSRGGNLQAFHVPVRFWFWESRFDYKIILDLHFFPN